MSSTPPTQQPSSPGIISLGRTDRPLNVGSFAKPVTLPPQLEAKRRLPGERKFRRFKSSRKSQFRFNFEKKPDHKEIVDAARENFPWDLKLGEVDYRGKPDPAHKNLVLVLNQGNDWKFFLCDKWYNFAIPPKPLTPEEMEKEKPAKNYFGRLSRIMGEGKTEKGEEEKADDPEVKLDESDHEAAPEDEFGDDKRDGEQDIDWDFEEKVDDDEGVESPGAVEEDKDFKFEEEEEEENDNEAETADKKKLEEEEKKNLKKMLKEVSKKDDMTFFFGPEEDSDDEFADDDDDEEVETKEEAATPVTPQESGKRKLAGEETQGQAKKAKTEGPSGGISPMGAEADPNLLTEDEVQRFLRAPATVKEIKLKFDPRLKQDKRNKELLQIILKKIADPKKGDGEVKFFLKQQ